jgi:hypothetical protein
MTKIDNQLFKLQSILKACQKIKDTHGIDVYHLFGVYFYNDDKLEYKEALCHAIIGKNCTAESLKQCSKSRSKNELNNKKLNLYCTQHFNISLLGEIGMCIICPDTYKKLQVNTNTNTELETTMTTPISIKKPKTILPSRRLRHIEIDGKVYYVDQTNLTMYDMDMSQIGKYAYDPETETHIICDM